MNAAEKRNMFMKCELWNIPWFPKKHGSSKQIHSDYNRYILFFQVYLPKWLPADCTYVRVTSTLDWFVSCIKLSSLWKTYYDWGKYFITQVLSRLKSSIMLLVWSPN